MSIASKKTATNETKERSEWQDKTWRSEALSKAVSLVQGGEYDPKNIVKDAQVFYQFLKGATK